MSIMAGGTWHCTECGAMGYGIHNGGCSRDTRPTMRPLPRYRGCTKCYGVHLSGTVGCDATFKRIDGPRPQPE